MPFTKTIEVRFRDCDMLQHVNNAVYLNYLEEARAGYYRHLLGEKHFQGFDFILGTVTIRYISPATLGELLDISVAVTDMRRSSFTMQYEVRSGSDGRLVAQAETIQVQYDYDKQSSKPIPDDLRARIEAYEGSTFPKPEA